MGWPYQTTLFGTTSLLQRYAKKFTTKNGTPNMQREQSCTLLWLRTTLTRYWPNFISHFQARLQIRNGLQLLLKIKQHFSTRGLSPSVLFLLLSWSHIGSRSQNSFKIRAFNLRVKNISTLDTQCISLIVVCSVIQKQGSQAFLLNYFIFYFYV